MARPKDHPAESLEAQAKAAECWITPTWAAGAILDVEVLTRRVLDPCCGTGVLTAAARCAGYDVGAFDLHDWGYAGQHGRADFLADPPLWTEWPLFEGTPAYLRSNRPAPLSNTTVFMNPPFSRATAFVDRAMALGARKIVCFQRYAWREAGVRAAWWRAHPPARIWLCGDRASCWLVTIPPEKQRNGTPITHAWFVWERGHIGAGATGALYRDGSHARAWPEEDDSRLIVEMLGGAA